MSNQQIRQEMTQIQNELEEVLKTLIQEFGKKLNDKERQEIENEFNELNELLERLKSGLIWVALFGKTSVGKSAVTNSLMNADVAKVGVEHDVTNEPQSYTKEPWKIVDVPGIMGKGLNEEIAIAEAKKAHGLIFVINGEPFKDEIESFDLVHKNSPDIPKIVFVNQWDIIQNNKTKKDQDTIRCQISEKMREFVKSPEDIVYGSAMLLDKERDEMIRKELPQLLDRLYENAGTLGTVVNVLDPANRAAKLNDNVNRRILAIRLQVARKVIGRFGIAAAFGIVLPFATLTVYPALLTSMVFTICKIMGKEVTKSKAGKIMWACLRIMGVNAALGNTAIVLVDAASTALTPVAGAGLALGGLAAITGIGWYCYSQTVKLGELTLEYLQNDFSWDNQDQKDILAKCQQKANEMYIKLQSQ